MSRSVDRWSPPPEPEKPAVPYRTGFQFAARRVKPPPPFLEQYYKVPTGRLGDFLTEARFPGEQFLRTTTLLDYCTSVASKPLPCEDLGETAALTVIGEFTVGDGYGRGGGSQVVTCERRGQNEPLVAKIYDPLYYPFADDDFPHIPNDVVARAEHDFAQESAAYSQLDERLGGNLIPKFHGSWLLHIPLKQLERPVRLILLELVEGVPLDTIDPKLHTKEERLRVLALAMEAAVRLEFAGVRHDDIAPRNIICSDKNLLAEDLRVKIIDFNFVTILPLLGADAPCKSEELPESPLKQFWENRPSEMRQWVPDGWGLPEWNRWLKERWGGSKSFKPVLEAEIQIAEWKHPYEHVFGRGNSSNN